MSEEISKIARVYQFLTEFGDWQSAADASGYQDGIITKAEFRSFMLGSDFEWENEDSDASKKDLINKFWATIDTKRSGRIAGSTKSNLDALDKNEVDKMQEKIEMYDMAIKYADSLSLPEGATVNDYSAWVKKIKESILTRVEKYIKDGGKLENLQEFLEAQGQEAVVITTADMIAQDLIKEKVGNVPNYGGYDGDEALQKIINSYVKSLKQNPNVSGAEISDTITRLVNAYVSTLDGMPSASDVELLGQYGYKITEKSGLNDLQKAVLNNSLTEKLAKIKVGDDYSKYPELFDQAIEEFIKSLLEGTKMSEFATVKNYGIPEFEASEAYKGLKVKLQVSKFFSSDTFKNKLKEELGETIADKIGNSMKGDFPALDKIIEDALKLAADGSFGNPIDENKLAEWAIKQVKAKLAEFFKDLDNLSLQEMNTVYKELEKSAVQNQNLEDLRNAAIMYCRALANKNAGLANMMKDLCKTRLGKDDYTAAINAASSSDIQAFMAELMQKALEIGDKHSAEITGGPTDSDSLIVSNSRVFKLQANITTNGTGSIDNSKVHFSISNMSGGTATIDDAGNLNIHAGNSAGYFQAKVSVMYYGNVIGYKDISILIKEKPVENCTDTFTVDDKEFNMSALNLANKGINFVTLCGSTRSLSAAASAAKSKIKSVLDALKGSLNGCNQTLVEQAYETTLNYYYAAIDAITIIDDNNTVGNSFQYYNAKTGKNESSSDKSNMRSAWDTADVNSATEVYKKTNSGATGLYIGHDKEHGGGQDNDKFYIFIDMHVLAQKFISFFNN